MHKTQVIWHKESLFQQYIFAQSRHQRHRNRGKHSFNTSLPSSSSMHAFKLNNKEIKTNTKTLFKLSLSKHVLLKIVMFWRNIKYVNSQLHKHAKHVCIKQPCNRELLTQFWYLVLLDACTKTNLGNISNSVW